MRKPRVIRLEIYYKAESLEEKAKKVVEVGCRFQSERERGRRGKRVCDRERAMGTKMMQREREQTKNKEGGAREEGAREGRGGQGHDCEFLVADESFHQKLGREGNCGHRPSSQKQEREGDDRGATAGWLSSRKLGRGGCAHRLLSWKLPPEAWKRMKGALAVGFSDCERDKLRYGRGRGSRRGMEREERAEPKNEKQRERERLLQSGDDFEAAAGFPALRE